MQYTVKSGDTLFLIAKRFYGDGSKYPLIAGANGISNVNLIRVGQVLTIPGSEKYGPLAPGEAPMIAPTGIVPQVTPSNPNVTPQPYQPAAPAQGSGFNMNTLIIIGLVAVAGFFALKMFMGGEAEEKQETKETSAPQEG